MLLSLIFSVNHFSILCFLSASIWRASFCSSVLTRTYATFIRCTSLDDRKIGSEMTERVKKNAETDPKIE